MKRVEVGITFGSKGLRVPPQRCFYVADPDEEPPWDLVKLTFDEFWMHMRRSLRRAAPSAFCYSRVLQAWVDSQWESLYNPIRVYRDGCYFRVFDGVHRLRSLTALDASHIWLYISSGVRFQGNKYPYWDHNIRAPRRGTRVAICSQCGGTARVANLRVPGGWRMYKCKVCGHRAKFVPYPRCVDQIVQDGEVSLDQSSHIF